MKLVAVSLVLLAVCLVATQATASAIYYRMENSGVSQDNSPMVDLTLGSTAGFSADVPGPQIQDGIGGVIYANTASYNHGGGTGSTANDYAVARAAIESAAGFTVEYFVKINEGATAAQSLKWDLVIKSDAWYMNLNAFQKPTFGATTAAFPDPTVANAWSEFSAPTTLSEGEWHHIAAVGVVVDDYPNSWTLYEEVTLYVDYVAVGSKRYYAQAGITPQHPRFQRTGDIIKIGDGNAFNSGLLDEIRISSVALTPDQFLQAVPEPTTIVLLSLGALGLFQKKRKDV